MEDWEPSGSGDGGGNEAGSSSDCESGCGLLLVGRGAVSGSTSSSCLDGECPNELEISNGIRDCLVNTESAFNVGAGATVSGIRSTCSRLRWSGRLARKLSSSVCATTLLSIFRQDCGIARSGHLDACVLDIGGRINILGIFRDRVND